MEYGVGPTNQCVNSGTHMLSLSLPPAFTVAQSLGRNSQSSVKHELLVVTPQYPINIVSAQSQPSTPQSSQSPQFYPSTTQQSSSRVLPQHNLMSPPQVPDLQSPLQAEQLPKFGDSKAHDEFIQPPRLNPPVHFSDHSSHSPEHMST